MDDVRGNRLNELRQVAEDAVSARGHKVGAWTAPSGADELESRATCSRCGRVVYVRVGSGMKGMAGAALTERCGQPVAAGAG